MTGSAAGSQALGQGDTETSEEYCLAGPLAFPDAAGCMRCDSAKRMALAAASGQVLLGQSGLIVCVDCGNKRCPKATDHTLACTGSNEPNQPGSAYQICSCGYASMDDRLRGRPSDPDPACTAHIDTNPRSM